MLPVWYQTNSPIRKRRFAFRIHWIPGGFGCTGAANGAAANGARGFGTAVGTGAGIGVGTGVGCVVGVGIDCIATLGILGILGGGTAVICLGTVEITCFGAGATAGLDIDCPGIGGSGTGVIFGTCFSTFGGA